ncbi:MAG: LolA-related protein [Rubrivivax sp.]
MISGATTERAARALLTAVALCTFCAATSALELSEVMGLLAQRSHVEATFSEERFVSGFEQPLRSSGTLSFTAPDNFARRTLAPRSEAMIVEGQRVTLERGERVRQLSLDAVPELAAIVSAVRGTLSGDAAALGQHFDIAVSGDTRQWSLRLEPREQRLLQSVRELRIDGALGEVRRVEVVLADGDRSVMQVEPVRSTPSTQPPRSRP